MRNLAPEGGHDEIIEELTETIADWQERTHDPVFFY